MGVCASSSSGVASRDGVRPTHIAQHAASSKDSDSTNSLFSSGGYSLRPEDLENFRQWHNTPVPLASSQLAAQSDARDGGNTIQIEAQHLTTQTLQLKNKSGIDSGNAPHPTQNNKASWEPDLSPASSLTSLFLQYDVEPPEQNNSAVRSKSSTVPAAIKPVPLIDVARNVSEESKAPKKDSTGPQNSLCAEEHIDNSSLAPDQNPTLPSPRLRRCKRLTRETLKAGKCYEREDPPQAKENADSSTNRDDPLSFFQQESFGTMQSSPVASSICFLSEDQATFGNSFYNKFVQKFGTTAKTAQEKKKSSAIMDVLTGSFKGKPAPALGSGSGSSGELLPVDPDTYIRELHTYCRTRAAARCVCVGPDGTLERLYRSEGWHRLKTRGASSSLQGEDSSLKRKAPPPDPKTQSTAANSREGKTLQNDTQQPSQLDPPPLRRTSRRNIGRQLASSDSRRSQRRTSGSDTDMGTVFSFAAFETTTADSSHQSTTQTESILLKHSSGAASPNHSGMSSSFSSRTLSGRRRRSQQDVSFQEETLFHRHKARRHPSARAKKGNGRNTSNDTSNHSDPDGEDDMDDEERQYVY